MSAGARGRRRGKAAVAELPPPAGLLAAILGRPLGLLAIAVALTVLFGYGARLVQTDASAALLMDISSAGSQDQQLYAKSFGADPVVVPTYGTIPFGDNHLRLS